MVPLPDHSAVLSATQFDSPEMYDFPSSTHVLFCMFNRFQTARMETRSV